jgi:quercetin dioxygenase-like cupin family protein
MALAQGEQQPEHEPRGEATRQVLHGPIRVLADGESWDAGPGDLQHRPCPS